MEGAIPRYTYLTLSHRRLGLPKMVFWRKSKPTEKADAATAEAATANVGATEAAKEKAVNDKAAAESSKQSTAETKATGKAAPASKAAPVEEPQTLEEITPNIRRRLQQFYVVGKKNLETGNLDYAIQMLQQPVAGDPANMEYAQTFFEALKKKYENPKKVSSMAGLQGMSIKGAMKKSAGKKQWRDVIKSGAEMLALNPYDIPTLIAMAEACQELTADDVQLFYLKQAMQANPKDAKLLKLAALALARIGDFGQAIVCWHRVEELKPGDEEALKMIGQLTVDRTVPKDKMTASTQPLNQKPNAETIAAKSAAKEKKAAAEEEKTLSREDQLKARIKAEPAVKEHYVELANYYTDQNQLQKAEDCLTKALQVAGPGDLHLRDKLEDFQISRALRQVEIAEHRANQEQTEEAANLVKKLRMELNRIELSVYTSRSDRAPTNETFRFEMGIRLKRAGKYKEAIENLQKCQSEGKRKASVHLELGECFQCINVHKLSMDNYEKAIEQSRDKDLDVLKKGLYRAGKLATGLKDYKAAEAYLTELAGLDFGYRDVAERLDKLSKIRNDG
jgi:tetratricopeptide (TPR) repeat protein